MECSACQQPYMTQQHTQFQNSSVSKNIVSITVCVCVYDVRFCAGRS